MYLNKEFWNTTKEYSDKYNPSSLFRRSVSDLRCDIRTELTFLTYLASGTSTWHIGYTRMTVTFMIYENFHQLQNRIYHCRGDSIPSYIVNWVGNLILFLFKSFINLTLLSLASFYTVEVFWNRKGLLYIFNFYKFLNLICVFMTSPILSQNLRSSLTPS